MYIDYSILVELGCNFHHYNLFKIVMINNNRNRNRNRIRNRNENYNYIYNNNNMY